MTDPNITALGLGINWAQIPQKPHEWLRSCKLPSAQYFLMKGCDLAEDQIDFLRRYGYIKNGTGTFFDCYKHGLIERLMLLSG
ncbi:hypothetical protein Q8A64_08275 [Oxalobacteraceae bacterium R-40]|uniref:Uncharacterized protein n=1 Tax=Keguizhuia sedimenti TaxID=3064264 RepID=A0ABU1BN63_9BURK|nr:hypothetical protein [Oxalobacteraceae bacterium R-40]